MTNSCNCLLSFLMSAAVLVNPALVNALVPAMPAPNGVPTELSLQAMNSPITFAEHAIEKVPSSRSVASKAAHDTAANRSFSVPHRGKEQIFSDLRHGLISAPQA